MILYMETNAIVGESKGHDIRLDTLLRIPVQALRIAMPAVCVMEAWSVFEAEQKQRIHFTRNTLRTLIREAERDLTSPHAGSLRAHLDAARLDSDNLLNDIERRQRDTLRKVAGRVELLSLTQDILKRSLRTSAPIEDPTDNLILTCILAHARRNRNEDKALLTGNSKDFDTPEVKNLLNPLGFIKYFTRTQDFLGWFNSMN